MSSVYKVAEVEGKGLGCIATTDIEKGSIILEENPQIYEGTDEAWTLKWIKTLMKSFDQMSNTDQSEFLTLHEDFKNFDNFPNSQEEQHYRMGFENTFEKLRSVIDKIEQDPDKAEKIFKICCIYVSNANTSAGCRIKTSRFNHSCEPNAMSIGRRFNGQQDKVL